MCWSRRPCGACNTVWSSNHVTEWQSSKWQQTACAEPLYALSAISQCFAMAAGLYRNGRQQRRHYTQPSALLALSLDHVGQVSVQPGMQRGIIVMPAPAHPPCTLTWALVSAKALAVAVATARASAEASACTSPPPQALPVASATACALALAASSSA
jgi:hypothetical protein